MSNRERTIESKGRIEFIDLAKGICILLVVMIHVGVPEYIPGLYAAKVPIFFPEFKQTMQQCRIHC